MAIPAGVLALVAADQAVKGLQDAIDQADQGGPNYLRDGEPQSLPARIGQAVGRSACRRYAEGDFELEPRAAAGYELACRPYLDSIDYGEGPQIALPFRGGQCPALYRVDVTYKDFFGVDRSTFTQNFRGPVVGLRPQPTNEFGNVAVDLVSGAGEQFTAFGLFNTNPANRNTGKIVSVARDDGGIDNCGNPAPIVTDPTKPPIETPNPEPFQPEPGTDIDLDVTINVDGSINFNIGVGVPIIIRPKFDFSPEADGDGDGDGDGGGDGPPSPPAPEPGPELPGGNGGFGGDDGFGEPPAGRRWVGCCIRLTTYPLNQDPIPGTIPEDVYPSVVGNIRLVFNAAGNRQTDTPVRILAKHVCVWEPVAKLNPVGISVDLLPGFGYVYTPYSVPLED